MSTSLGKAFSWPDRCLQGFPQGERVVLKLLFSPTAQVCPLPPVVSHGDFICHPRPCDRYNHGTVVEFYCDPGYSLTSDYKYITCQYGEWFPSYQVYCIKSGERARGLALAGRSRVRLHTVAGGCVWSPHTVLATGTRNPSLWIYAANESSPVQRL